MCSKSNRKQRNQTNKIQLSKMDSAFVNAFHCFDSNMIVLHLFLFFYNCVDVSCFLFNNLKMAQIVSDFLSKNKIYICVLDV